MRRRLKATTTTTTTDSAAPLEGHMSSAIEGDQTRARTNRFSKKSSQACDQCRKRKVRCDLNDLEPSLDGKNRCTTCETQNLPCTFEHVPRQRGPVRGFKRNKRRLSEMEESAERTMLSMTSPAASEATPGHASSLPSDHAYAPPTDRRRGRRPDSEPAPLSGTLFEGAPAVPMRTKSFVAVMSTDPSATEAHDLRELRWMQHAVDRWFLLYQPTFPLLDDSLQTDGFSVAIHPLLRSALLLAIYSIVFRTRTSRKLDAVLAEQVLTQYNATVTRHSAPPQTMLDRLTHLQVTMLLAIEADQRGYAVATSVQTVGYWLGRASAQAYDLRLHDERLQEFAHETGEMLLGRRLYLILIILDRWHSVSTSSPPFIADSFARFDIQFHFSGITHHLYRLSIIVGHVYVYIMSPRPSSTPLTQSPRFMGYNNNNNDNNETGIHNNKPGGAYQGSSDFAKQLLKSELDDWRAKVEVIWGQSNLLHVAYWHICILSILGSSHDAGNVLDISDLRDLAMRLASTLNSNATPYTPLNHHFYSLTACVLSHLLTHEETCEDARKGLTSLREAVERHRELVEEDDASWDSTLLLVVSTQLRTSPIHTRRRPSAPSPSSPALAGHDQGEGDSASPACSSSSSPSSSSSSSSLSLSSPSAAPHGRDSGPPAPPAPRLSSTGRQDSLLESIRHRGYLLSLDQTI